LNGDARVSLGIANLNAYHNAECLSVKSRLLDSLLDHRCGRAGVPGEIEQRPYAEVSVYGVVITPSSEVTSRKNGE
jgi:hypothetical protein